MPVKGTLFYGFGINDADYATQPLDKGKGVMCPFYQAWANMLKRAFSGSDASYKDVSVCNEWRSFMAFRTWMITQDWRGNHLDKDIIKPENRIYSPEFCSFVSIEVNNLLLNNSSRQGDFPTGVYRDKRDGRYCARCRVNAKSVSLGTYSTPEEASSAYRKFKATHIISIALTQENKVFKGLLRHAKILLEDK